MFSWSFTEAITLLDFLLDWETNFDSKSPIRKLTAFIVEFLIC